MASSSGISHGRVIVDCELGLRKFLSLEKLVPAMVEKKLFKKKFGERLVKKDDTGLFVDCLKQLTLEQFGVFLTVVRSIEEEEGKERRLMKLLSSSLKSMKLKPGTKIQTHISDFIKAADSSALQTSSERPSTTVGSITDISKASEVITQQTQIPPIHSEVEVETITESMRSTIIRDSSLASVEASIEEVSSARLPFPHGFMSGCKTRSFTREGGMLYSPEHGVTVIIPEGAVPSSIDKFTLGVYVYLNGSFRLPQNVRPCSPLVWFRLHPKFTFIADVTVKIPHSAWIQYSKETTEADEESLTVLTVEEGLDDSATHIGLTRCLDADFSDGYHAVFGARHFSPHRVVMCEKQHLSPTRNRLGSDGSSGVKKRSHDTCPVVNNFCLPGACKSKVTTKEIKKSGSLQDEEESERLYVPTQGDPKKRNKAKQKFYIARCMPLDRSSISQWTVDFLISHFHPTGIRAINQYAQQLHGESLDIMKRKFYFTEEDLKFVPNSWTSVTGCWNVAATETSILSMDEIVMQLPSPSTKLTACDSESIWYLPRVTYSVQAETFPPSQQLDCKIDVRGAEVSKGEPLFFKLQSKISNVRRAVRRTIYTVTYLYSPTSDILSALSQPNRNLHLDLHNGDHIKLLIDISLQLTREGHPQSLAQALCLEHHQLEEIQCSSSDISWQVYSLLRTWLARSVSGNTLGALLDALSKIEVEGVRLSEAGAAATLQSLSLVPSCLDQEPIPGSLFASRDGGVFLLSLSEKIQCCWRKIGSLMGIPKASLDVQACQYHQLYEQSYQLLLSWCKERGLEATHGVVFRAIQRLHELSPDVVNDAWCYCVYYLEHVEHLNRM